MSAGRRSGPARRTRLFAIFAAAVFAAAVVAGAFLIRVESVPTLVVKDPHGRLLQAVEAPDGRFDHVFLHSVHRSQVIERFRIEGSGGSRARLHLFELVYEDAGVGMPTDAEGGLRLENGRFVLSMDRGFAAIPIRVSVVPGHGLAIDGAWWPLRNFARPGEGIVLAARMALKIRFRR